MCARYFERLDDQLASAAEGIDDPLERALQLGLAYVRFAVATPVLYRVAFGKPADAAHPSKVDQVLAASAYTRFVDTVTELADEGGLFGRDDVNDVVLELWAAAHGIASLMLSKPGLGWGGRFPARRVHAQGSVPRTCGDVRSHRLRGPPRDRADMAGDPAASAAREAVMNDKMVKGR